MAMPVHFIAKSSNVKVGPIPVSTTGKQSCPPTCPFKGNGCYADNAPLVFHWNKVTDGYRAIEWGEFCAHIESLEEGTLWRHNQAGDLPGENGHIDDIELFQLVAANIGKRGFTYTHYLPHIGTNARAIKAANDNGFTVNLSANNVSEVDALCDLGIGPVVVTLPADQTANLHTPKGRTIVVCPATQRDDVSCATCQLCQRQRSSVVGFPAHGAQQRKTISIVSIAA